MKDLEDIRNTTDDFVSEFRNRISNDFESGHSFIAYCAQHGILISSLTDMDRLCALIVTINEYYRDNFGAESVMDWTKYNVEFIIHHYVYYYVHSELDDTYFEGHVLFPGDTSSGSDEEVEDAEDAVEELSIESK